jgi:hypothetical protein
MADNDTHENKPDVEQKRRQEIERQHRSRDGNQEETGGPGSPVKQHNQQADGQRQQGRDGDQDKAT